MIPGITAGGAGGFVALPDANTLALLHFDGANGSTTFTDEKGNTWVADGNAQLSTTLKVFGASSLLLDGSGDSATMTPALAIGAGDFTLEAWMRWASRSGNNFVFSFGAGWGLYTFSSNWAVFDGAASNVIMAGVVNDAVFYHAALVRASGTLALFVGDGGPGSTGTRLATVADSTNHSTAFLRLGAQPSGAGASNGNIDEFRYSNVARYAGATYTVPSAAFTP